MYTFVIGVYEAGVFRNNSTNKLIQYETVKAKTPNDALSLVTDMYMMYSNTFNFSILRSDYQ